MNCSLYQAPPVSPERVRAWAAAVESAAADRPREAGEWAAEPRAGGLGRAARALGAAAKAKGRVKAAGAKAAVAELSVEIRFLPLQGIISPTV